MVYQEIVDDLGRKLSIKKHPQRIISLVPSLTELLVDLGLEDKLVGITRFCIHPKRLKKEKAQVGGTKKVNYAKIKALKPDFILCNKEENTKEMVIELQKIAPVYVTAITSIEDTLETVLALGGLLNCSENALKITKTINSEYLKFKEFIANQPKRKTAYFIWKSPWMVAGENTFINELLALNNFENSYINQGHYPTVDINQLAKLDLLLLSSEPYPFQEKDAIALTEKTGIKTILVDGEYFSWYGSRLIQAFSYFKTLQQSLND